MRQPADYISDPDYAPEVLPRVAIRFAPLSFLQRLRRIFPWVRRREREAQLSEFVQGLYKLTDMSLKVVEEETNRIVGDIHKRIDGITEPYSAKVRAVLVEAFHRSPVWRRVIKDLRRHEEGFSVFYKLMETFNGRLTLAGERFDRLEESSAAYEARIKELEDKVKECEGMIAGHQIVLSNHASAFAILNDRLSKLETRHSNLTSTVDSHQSRLGHVEKDVHNSKKNSLKPSDN